MNKIHGKIIRTNKMSTIEYSNSFNNAIGIITPQVLNNCIIYKNNDELELRLKFIYSIGNSLRENFVYQVIDNKGIIFGSLSNKEVKTGLFNNYGYKEIIFNDTLYKVYTIGFGKNGIKHAIWYGDTSQIASIHRDCNVNGNLDTFDFNMVDGYESLIDIINLYIIYSDFIMYNNHSIFTIPYKETTLKYTTDKHLLSKYDKSFDM